MSRLTLPPLSLYIHIPWCVRKCPYCDFNSHQSKSALPIDDYVKALAQDLENDQGLAHGRKLDSIFFGGGTPSLFPASAIKQIIDSAKSLIGFERDIEITLEANPGTVEHHDFSELRATGVNRLSLGIQSFSPQHLKSLGRIHSDKEATDAVARAQAGGFDNINIDLMHGLPDQTLEQARQDLEHAFALAPQHISWYQLTIEQNTEFFSRPPTLPQEDTLIDIMEMGLEALTHSGYEQYEVSAFGRPDRQSRHNLNYWQFGDYLAIGAGAHGKITSPTDPLPFRYRKTRQPNAYLDTNRDFTAHQAPIALDNIPLEFMMNALRLNEGVPVSLFEQRAGLSVSTITPQLLALQREGLLEVNNDTIIPTANGRLFLNTLLERFA
ncbi:MAG: radical SAM family heme chaperone HemW [Agarilytica sp.]